MAENGVEHLRVLIANERRNRFDLLAQVVSGLGHEVIAREVDVKEVGAVTASEDPDVALVGLGLSSAHALEMIGEIVREASCPVIALLATRDPAYVHEAAKRTTRKLRRGVHRSVKELNADIEDWVEHWNENPNPYVWTKTADEILDNLAGCCNTIDASGHQRLLAARFLPRRSRMQRDRLNARLASPHRSGQRESGGQLLAGVVQRLVDRSGSGVELDRERRG
jgi:CheY-like chemotaxis protein